MGNPGLIKTYNAEAAVPAFTIVKPGANDYGVVHAAAATDAIMGVSSEVAAVSGGPCDVVHTGIAPTLLGGTVAAGDPITSDANGAGVKAAPAAVATDRILGYVIIAGVSGDIAPVLLALGSLSNAANS